MRARHLLAPSLALLLVVACSGDDDSGTATPSSPDASTDAAKHDASVKTGDASPSAPDSSTLPVDASVKDSSLPDASIPDSSGPDASIDSGIDSGTPDSGTPDSGTADAGMVPDTITLAVSANCETVADGYCNLLERCFSPKLLQVYGGDAAGCRVKYARTCSKADVASGAHPFSDSDAKTCGDALKAASCTADPESLGGISGSCDRRGTRAPGGACELDEQCATGVCDVDFDSDCGTCLTPAVAGAACNGVNSDTCASGLNCVANTCKAPVAAGAACPSGDSSECPSPQRCVNGTCGTALAEGAACTRPANVGLFNGPCDAGQLGFCSSATNKCASLAVAAQGGTCAFFSVFCRGDERCVFNAAPDQFNGNCFPRKADGASCNDDGEQCLSPGVCDSSNTCVVKNPNRCQ